MREAGLATPATTTLDRTAWGMPPYCNCVLTHSSCLSRSSDNFGRTCQNTKDEVWLSAPVSDINRATDDAYS